MATGRVPTTANSPLTAKGDVFTYSTAPARLAVGSDGETLVADSAATTGLRWSGTPSANNPILNGAFDIWQRGTSFSISASSAAAYYPDRFQLATNANQAVTLSRQATGDTTNLANIQYCARIQRNSGQTGTGDLNFATTFESSNSIPFAGKTITVSFYARAGANYSAASSALKLYLVSGTGTDQNLYNGFTGSSNVINQTATLTTTWQRFTYSATVGATSTQLGLYFNFTPVGTASTNDYYEVTGIQLDVGSVALPFRRSGGTIQGELAACQRYYQKSYDTGTTPATNTTQPGLVFAASGNVGVSGGITNVPLKVEMRSAPTVTIYSYTSSQTGRVSDNNGTDLAANSGTTQYIGTRSFYVYNNSGGTLTAAQNGFVFHYVASSEL